VADRVLRIYERVQAYGPPRLTLDRALLFTESFKQTEGEALVLRWAKALKTFAEGVPVTIFDDELIVGRPNTWLGRWALVYPELDGGMMRVGLRMLEKSRGAPGEVVLTADDERVIDEVLAPYWAGRDFATNFFRNLPADTRLLLTGPDPKNVALWTYVIVAASPLRHSASWVPDFAKVVRRGAKGIRDEALAKLATLTDPRDLVRKKPFLDAVVVVCDAMTTWSRRYAARARELAATQRDTRRRRELREIAEVCDRVPEHPARTFREALQAQWFAQLFNRAEQMTGALGQGRIDQYLWPYYRADIDEGRITRESAMELLHCLWLQMSQVAEIKLNPVIATGTAARPPLADVCLGGQTPDGLDATNELSVLVLDSMRSLPLTGADLAVRIHADSPDHFVRRIADSIKDGRANPKLLNDEDVIPFYLAHGATRKEALDWSVSGGCESRLPNREVNVTAGGIVNLGIVCELALRDGRAKLLGELQVGTRTGDPRRWTSFDQVWSAVRSQLEHLVRHVIVQQHIAMRMKPSYFAAPQTSMLHDLAMAECRDLNSHGEPFTDGIQHSTVDAVGKGTAVDSLAALKHLVFDTGKVSWEHLLAALEANWKGHDELRQLCRRAPKHGTGIEWVDGIGFDLETAILELLRGHREASGDVFVLRHLPVTIDRPFGRVTAATPDGRRAADDLAEGISPPQPPDLRNTTVVLASVARGRNRSFAERGPDFLGLTSTPVDVAGERGTRRMVQLVREWSRLKLWHLQVSVDDPATLLGAQRDPHRHRDLLVRIGGRAVCFVDLSPAQQAVVIARVEAASAG
jgi:formate C-acetyltransferase